MADNCGEFEAKILLNFVGCQTTNYKRSGAHDRQKQSRLRNPQSQALADFEDDLEISTRTP